MKFGTVRTLLLMALVAMVGCAQEGGVAVQFDPATPATGPFPTDYLTVSDAAQRTGRAVRLPSPDCADEPSECALVAALNELDGFHLTPRMTVSFSAAIDASTLRAGIAVVKLGQPGRLSTINQVVYDAEKRTAYAKPDDFLDQGQRYALVVTDAVRDVDGYPVVADARFTACLETEESDYCAELREAAGRLAGAALPGKLVALSVFTTMSATSWLEGARDAMAEAPVRYRALGSAVKTAGLTSIVLKAQTGVSPVTFQNLTLPVRAGVFEGVDRIVFGSYDSPNFLNERQYIAAGPSAEAVTLPGGTNAIQVHAYVPSSPMPEGGYPVVIFGHGIESNSFVPPTLASSTFARAGFVTLALNAVGHGYGPQSTLQLVQEGNALGDFAGFGRGVDLDGDGKIGASEGCFLSWPYPVGLRDCLRQTAVDLMQLVTVVQSGVELEPGSGLKLDGNRIYYAGGSLGGMYGTMLHAVDGRVKAMASIVGGGSTVDHARWAPTYRGYGNQWVGGRTPSLMNDGSGFSEDFVLRNQPVKVSETAGAIPIQNLFGSLEWLQAAGDPLSYAPHVKLSPLDGVAVRPALFLFAVGDQSIPNPANSALIRAAGMWLSSTMFRSDVARTVAEYYCCRMPADSHGFFSDNTSPANLAFSRAAQQQVAGFFASDGAVIPDANEALKKLLPFATEAQVFETPSRDVETFNFGKLGISIQQDLVLDETPAIEWVLSGGGGRESVQPNIQAGSLVSIRGTNLAGGTAVDAELPETLAGVSVMIDWKPARVYSVSREEVQVVAPEVSAGLLDVVVSRDGVSSAGVRAPVVAAAPALLVSGEKYALLTQPADMAAIAGLRKGVEPAATRPGEVVTLWGTGLGMEGTETSVTVGGEPAEVVETALQPGLAGIYRIAIRVPAGVAPGDAEVRVSAGGSVSPGGVFLWIGSTEVE
jgi:uncharacterized protein (TIGR03437 family)